MIKILVVEDNEYKLGTIKRLLKDDLLLDDGDVHIAKDVKSAKRQLKLIQFDLLILDLVLPINKGDDVSPDNCIQFLNDINSNDRINSPIHIVGLTEFEELHEEYEKEFRSFSWLLINYSANEVNWQLKIKNLINHLVSIRRQFLVTFEDDKQEIAIICALSAPEFDAVMKLTEWVKLPVKNDSTVYYSTHIQKGGKTTKIVTACANQMGMTALATLATKICLRFNPTHIFMVGICAGIKDRGMSLGDILIAEQAWDYGSGKMREDESIDGGPKSLIFEPDLRPIPLNAELKGKLKDFMRDDSIRQKIQAEWQGVKCLSMLQAHMGPVASGSYVVSSSKVLNDIIKQNRKLLGVEMEAYGLYYASKNSLNIEVKCAMVKSLSDFADSSKNDGSQQYAAYTSAQFVWRFIMEELAESFAV